MRGRRSLVAPAAWSAVAAGGTSHAESSDFASVLQGYDNAADVKLWVQAENAVTDAYLATIPQRAAIRAFIVKNVVAAAGIPQTD